MTVRFAFVPYESAVSSGGMTYRAPKYFGGARGLIPTAPELAGIAWSGMDYGFVNYGLVCADLTPEQFAWLDAQPNVIGIPEDLEANVTTAEDNFMTTRLEAVNVPADWLTTAMTRRQALRRICGLFQYMQRVMTIRSIATGTVQNPFAQGATLEMSMSSVPLVWRNAMQQAANEFGYDYSWVTGTTTLRQLLNAMAAAWGSKPFYFGNVEL